MNNGKLRGSPVWNVLCAFFIGSVVSGLIFAWCVTRPALHGIWFHVEGFWIFPTAKLWLLAACLFFLNLAGPYFVAHSKKWLSFSAYRLIIGGALISLLPLSVWLIEPLTALSQFLLFRLTLVLVLSLTLLVITQRWHWGLAILMLVLSLTTPLIASIPYAFSKSVSPEWFEVSKFFVSSSLLVVFFGYWLAKEIVRHDSNNSSQSLDNSVPPIQQNI